jgi:large subunit ribosomal protein L3
MAASATATVARKGILGRKLGMTRVFDEQGRQIAVTVIQAGPCVVVQHKTPERDGYAAVQVGYWPAKPSRVTRPLQGHFRKVGVTPRRVLREFVWDGEPPAPGTEYTVEIFRAGDRVDVIGVSKGKGFAGVVKRHHARRGPMSHGSKYHRRVGALNSGTSPARVFKNRQMPGRMGGRRTTVSDLEVVRVDPERHLLLVKGGVPGSRGAFVAIRTAKKALRQAQAAAG